MLFNGDGPVWCDAHGRKEPGTEETFGRDLRAAVPSIDKTRPRTPEGRLHFYAGIRLRCDSDPDRHDAAAPDGHSGHRGHSDHPFNATPQEGVDAARGPNAVDGREDGGRTMAGHGDHGDRSDRPADRLFGADDYRRWLTPD